MRCWETVGTCKMKSYGRVAVEQEERAVVGRLLALVR